MKLSLTESEAAGARDLARRARAQLFDHILPFWCGPALDHEQGGWMAWLSNDLQPDRTQPKGLILHSRILWAFSAAYQAQPDPLYRQMAERAFDYRDEPLLGHATWRRVLAAGRRRAGCGMTRRRPTARPSTSTRWRSIIGSSAQRRRSARALELFELIERHAHDAEFGGYVEVCAARLVRGRPDARLSEKDLNEKKSMNNHLHVLEAYTNLHRVCRVAGVQQRLRELIRPVPESASSTRAPVICTISSTKQWRVRSDTYTFGHDIEASWLLCEAAEELGDAALLRANPRRRPCAWRRLVRDEGLDADGGLYYEGKAGQVIDRGKRMLAAGRSGCRLPQRLGALRRRELSRSRAARLAVRGATPRGPRSRRMVLAHQPRRPPGP